ncbi:MAG: hypothetical protein U0Q16_32230 [Bryobacteraceae bacterium]
MGQFDISFTLAERSPYRVIRAIGHHRIGSDAVVVPIEREVAVPLRSVDQAFVVEEKKNRWVEHFEAEAGLSAEDRRAIVDRADLLRMKSGLPVWTTIVLMSRHRGPARPPRTLQSREGSITVTLQPRWVKLWEVPAAKLVEDDVLTLPWVAAMRARRGEIEAAIERIKAIPDSELRGRLSAEMTTLSHLQYGKDEVAIIRRKFSMVTSKQIFDSTPLAQEAIEYGKSLGLEKGLERGLEQGLEKGLKKGRQGLLRLITQIIHSRIPGYGSLAWLERINNIDELSNISSALIAAPDANACRGLLARYKGRR